MVLGQVYSFRSRQRYTGVCELQRATYMYTAKRFGILGSRLEDGCKHDLLLQAEAWKPRQKLTKSTDPLENVRCQGTAYSAHSIGGHMASHAASLLSASYIQASLFAESRRSLSRKINYGSPRRYTSLQHCEKNKARPRSRTPICFQAEWLENLGRAAMSMRKRSAHYSDEFDERVRLIINTKKAKHKQGTETDKPSNMLRALSDNVFGLTIRPAPGDLQKNKHAGFFFFLVFGIWITGN